MSLGRRLLPWIVGVLVLALLGGAVWLIWFSTVFAIERVKVAGVTGVPAEQVLSAAGVRIGTPMARIDAERIADQVEALPWVGTVEVRRAWPSDIVLAVAMRQAVARVPGTTAGIDGEGTVFEPVTPLPAGLPEVTAQGAALIEAIAVLASLPADLTDRVVAVRAATPDSVELVLRSGSTVRWGSADEAEAKARVLTALLARRALLYDVTAPSAPSTFGERRPAP